MENTDSVLIGENKKREQILLEFVPLLVVCTGPACPTAAVVDASMLSLGCRPMLSCLGLEAG